MSSKTPTTKKSIKIFRAQIGFGLSRARNKEGKYFASSLAKIFVCPVCLLAFAWKAEQDGWPIANSRVVAEYLESTSHVFPQTFGTFVYKHRRRRRIVFLPFCRMHNQVAHSVLFVKFSVFCCTDRRRKQKLTRAQDTPTHPPIPENEHFCSSRLN